MCIGQKLLLTAKMDIKQTDADATMMEVNRKQMLLLRYDDGGEQEIYAVATMMEVNRQQMLLLLRRM